jgi:tetratricopeptide (TPR) repeat protein
MWAHLQKKTRSRRALRRPGLFLGVAVVAGAVWWGVARSPGPEVSSSPPPSAGAALAPSGMEPATEWPALGLPGTGDRAGRAEADGPWANESAGPPDDAARAAEEGRSALRRGDSEAALAAFERALALEPDHAQYLREAGSLARALGRLDGAEAYLLRALESEGRSAGVYAPGVAETLSQLGGVYLEQRRYDEAESAYLRALAIEQRTQGGASTRIAAAHTRLGLLYQLQGRAEEAFGHLTQALDVQYASPPEPPYVAARMAALGEFQRSQGAYDEAEPLLERALEILEAAHGPGDVRTAGALIGLARLYDDQGRYAEAEPLLQRALALHESAYGSAHPSVVHDLARLSTLHLAQESYAHAQPHTARAFALDDSSPGSGKPRMAAALDQLAHTLRAQGRREQAEALYEWAIDVATQTLGPDSASAIFLSQKYAEYLQDADPRGSG